MPLTERAYTSTTAPRCARTVAFDTETCLIQPGLLVPPMVCLTSSWDGEGADIFHRDDPALPREVEGWLAADDVEIVGANTPYDLAQIVATFPDLAPLVWAKLSGLRCRDVLTEQKLLDIAEGSYGFARGQKSQDDAEDLEGGPYSLQSVYHRHTGIVLPKDTWRLRYGELIHVPVSAWEQEAVRYAKDDARATWRLADLFGRNDPEWSLLGDSQRQMCAKWWLYLTSAWGFPTDRQSVDEFETKVREHLQRILLVLCKGSISLPSSRRRALEVPAELREQFAAGLGEEEREKFAEYLAAPPDAAPPLLRVKISRGTVVGFSRDTKAAKERMVTVHALAGTKPRLTETGQVSLDEEACRDSCDDVLGAYAEFTSLAKVVNTDVPILRMGLIQSRFEEIQNTGRTGSSRPNIQNMPRFPGVRECYTARPGCVLIDCDFDILELRTLAKICLWTVGASVLAEKLNAGEDPHMYMGAALAGVSYECAKSDPKTYKDWRQRAKPVNFGVPGGMGPTGLRAYAKANYGVLLTLEEAARYRNLYLDTWPEVREYFARIRKDLRWRLDRVYGGDVTDIKHFVSGRFRGRVPYTVAANSFFQGLASDLAKACGFRVARECYDPTCGSPLFGGRIVNFIHDQYIVDMPEQLAHEAAMRVAFIMRDESRNWIPDVLATTTPALSRRFSKGTEAVYRNGRLVPFEDAKCQCGKILLLGTQKELDTTLKIVDKKGTRHGSKLCAA